MAGSAWRWSGRRLIRYCPAVLRFLRLVALPLAASATLLALAAPPASANPIPKPIGASPRAGENTEIVMTGTGQGRGVKGFIAEETTAFDPVGTPYPDAPPEGFKRLDEPFAGVIHAEPVGGGAQMTLYCIDILTATFPGIGYHLGSWDNTTVPNVDLVGQLLNNFFPQVPDQPALANDNEKAAAVQAAIWYFTDNYVIDAVQEPTLHAEVAAIVKRTKDLGPLPAQPKPTLTITPAVASGPQGTVVGPYTINSSVDENTVTSTGADMFKDAAATEPIAQGAVVPDGQKIWLKSTSPEAGAAVLSATATATVPTGNVYIYDGNTPGTTKAQNLILSQHATLDTKATADAEFKAPGSLKVEKTIKGAQAGNQAEVTIETTCGGVLQEPVLHIPAGAPAGTTSHTYSPIAAGTICTVTETQDGHTATVQVTVTGDGQQATVPSDGTVTATIVDDYTKVPVGGLVVRKTITGPAGGQQGEIVIKVTCGGVAQPDFVIPAGTDATTLTKHYADIPVGTSCTVTEISDGATSTVQVQVDNPDETVSVPAADAAAAEVSITDIYTEIPGNVRVSKKITGPAAGQQGEIGILVICDPPNDVFAFRIPANTAGGTVSRVFNNIPAGTKCTVVEATNGDTNAIEVATDPHRQEVTVPAASTMSAHITNTFTAVEAAPALAATGQRVSGLLATGGGAVLLGVGLLTAGRGGRRRRTRRQAT